MGHPALDGHRTAIGSILDGIANKVFQGLHQPGPVGLYDREFLDADLAKGNTSLIHGGQKGLGRLIDDIGQADLALKELHFAHIGLGYVKHQIDHPLHPFAALDHPFDQGFEIGRIP